MKKNITLILMSIAISACSDADMASRNLSKAADDFQIERRIVFYNGITGEYILTIQGLCSIGNNDQSGKVSITCKTGLNEFRKHHLGLSDNVTFFSEQIGYADVSTSHYKVIFKPSVIIPDIDLK